ncbi:unnamed protein product, partial [marine sediment metagenome]
GKGIPFKITDKSFQEKGHYGVIYREYCSTGVHKPFIMADVFDRINDDDFDGINNNDFIVYLDADLLLLKSIDEIINDNYDIGVIQRSIGGKITVYPKYFGNLCAGVMFFNNTAAAKRFIEVWKLSVMYTNSDQYSLNLLLGDLNIQNWITIEENGKNSRTGER